MADLSVLLQDLGDRIANKGDAFIGTQQDEDDAVESRFRSVLPTLLEFSIVPSKVKERELMAILKLLCMMVKHFPGVFYNGEGKALLPILRRLIPLFAEMELRSCHEGLFETWSAFMTLLRTGECSTYRRMFVDGMILIEDLVSVASFYYSPTAFTAGTKLSVQCFVRSYSELGKEGGEEDSVGQQCKPLAGGKVQDGEGLCMDLTGGVSWQPVANWTIKLLGYCLKEGALHLEGLVTSPFISAVASLVCFGDSGLQMACFDFITVATSVLDVDSFPSEKLIKVLITILSLSGGQLLPFRSAAFDSALGACLFSLCSSCDSGTIESIAPSFSAVMLHTVKQTASPDLRVVMCNTFYLILKQCPSYALNLPELLELACFPGIVSSLSNSLQLCVKLLGPAMASVESTGVDNPDISKVSDSREESGSTSLSSVTHDTSEECEGRPAKRQRLRSGVQDVTTHTSPVLPKPIDSRALVSGLANEGSSILDRLIDEVKRQDPTTLSMLTRKDMTSPAALALKSVLQFISDMAPSMLKIDNKLASLSVLVQMFGAFPGTVCHKQLVQLMHKWLYWACNAAEQESLTKSQLSLILQSVQRIIAEYEQSTDTGNNSGSGTLQQRFLGASEHLNAMQDVLLLPWSGLHSDQENLTSRMKCHAVWIASKLGEDMDNSKFERIVWQALQDKEAQVRAAAVLGIPSFINSGSLEMIQRFCKTVGSFGKDEAEEVREAVASIVGVMVCIHCHHLFQIRSALDEVPGTGAGRNKRESVCLLCCDRRPTDRKGTSSDGSEGMQDKPTLSPLVLCQHLFSELLFQESSEDVQVCFIGCIPQLLLHATTEEIALTRKDWLECLDTLPLHRHRSVREAFGAQIKLFVEPHVLAGVFGGQVDDSETSQALQMLWKLKHALTVAEDPDVLDTLIETIAEVVKVSQHRRQLLFFSLVLLVEQLDSKHLSLRTKSVKLIHETGSIYSQQGEAHRSQSIVGPIREDLSEYLINRLCNRPVMIQEFAESVLGIECGDLLNQIVPLILPKLVLNQQDSQQALDTMNELAKQLNTTLPELLVDWCHRVLSFVLLRADGAELEAVVDFYFVQTGSNYHEIFTAALDALLGELVFHLGDTDSDEAIHRSTRVEPMMQQVAVIVTGSDDLPTFLRDHFNYLLGRIDPNNVDPKLLKANNKCSQKQALGCIEHLVKMIGPHINTFVPNIMALLTQALQDGPLQVSCLKVWLSFVRTLVKTSPASARNVASQITVVLMPCLEGQEDEQNVVVEILEELVLNNEGLLEDQALELPLLPSLPALSKVNAVLHKARGSLSLRDQLRRAADGLTHDSTSVRYMTGSELTKVMRTQRADMTAMLVGESGRDVTVLSNLVTALLRGCAEESRTAISQRLKMACAECLGELGAIDPVRLQVDLCHQLRIKRSNEDLVFELINEHLARILRTATGTEIQKVAALAIQELLELSGCQEALLGSAIKTSNSAVKCKIPSSKSLKLTAKRGNDGRNLDNNGEQLWRRFADDVKEIITPCLTSKYVLSKEASSIPAGPIFRPGMTFSRWTYSWIRRLISQSTGQRAKIFRTCMSVVLYDMGVGLYLLPYLVLNVVCDGTAEARTAVTDEILAVLAAEAASITTNSMTRLDGSHGNASRGRSGSEVSTQAVFTLIDDLGQWLDDCKQLILNQSSQVASSRGSSVYSESKEEFAQLAKHRENVLQLLAAIPKQSLAGASFRCQAFPRALLYFETHVREKSGALNPAAQTSGRFADEDLTFLLEIYSGLDEPDGLSGLSRLRTSTSLQDQILLNEKAGNWAEALTCCEQALQMEPTSVSQHSGVLSCLFNMGHLQATVTHVDGLISRLPDHKREWCMWGIQAAWRLGQWDLLEEYVGGADGSESLANSSDSNVSFDINLAKILQALQRKDLDLFAEQIMHSREALLAPLAAASMESYTRAYPLIVKLQMLQELEDYNSLAIAALKEEPDSSQPKVSMTDLIQHWESRLKVTQPSLWAREPILALRRLIFSAIDLQPEVGICWLQYAKLCRAAGHFESANRAILQAQSVGAPNAHIESAKLLWDTKKSHRAITELQQALSNVSRPVLGKAFHAALGGTLHIYGQSSVKDGPLERARGVANNKMSTQARKDGDLETAKTLLLLARWVHHTGQRQKDDVVSLFTQVKELQPSWEKGFFFMAKYFDDLLVDARRRQEENQDLVTYSVPQKRNLTTDDLPWWNYLPDVLLFYAKGLLKGHRHLFQAMPRLLTLWFQFGSSFSGPSVTANKAVKAVNLRVMALIRGCLKDLPAYQWLTSLPQLVSRICHQNDEVKNIVKHIITTVLQSYPQQALWSMAAVTKSIVAARKEAAAEIIHQSRNSLGQDREKVALFSQFTNLIDQMIALCNYAGQPKSKTISLGSDFGYLKRLMPVRVIVPLQRALTVTLPSHGHTNMDYNPFPASEFSTISGIGDEIEILASLQRPKKVVLLGSDGTEHPFLCKPKDDLRKDARMMEFTTMINRLLSKDSNSRRRKLYIRTFAVIPLSEDCGMIEWVLHTRGLRHILQDLYVSCDKFDRVKTNSNIKRIYDQNQALKTADRLPEAEMLRTKILPLFPPIFHRWFLNMFPEPAAWFQARVAYAHTTAVWSMVGHIVGLGDRHGENILFDSTTGDCVHVDFSCLFDKGLQLEKPELVPFRLTQNMVDGLGITGYEGMFLRVSEITLSVLRSHSETLMSILETFIHDPLVEWTKSSHKSSGVEVQNPHAQKAIANIEARLEGVVVGVAAAPSLPLSVEGQAHRLIAEAVSHENLSKMYIWWMPWF